MLPAFEITHIMKRTLDTAGFVHLNPTVALMVRNTNAGKKMQRVVKTILGGLKLMEEVLYP